MKAPGQTFPPIQLPPPPGLLPPPSSSVSHLPSSPPASRANLKHGRTEDAPADTVEEHGCEMQRACVEAQSIEEQDVRDEMAVDKDLNPTQ
ncbi:hypothetical protein H0H92_015058 [Tricholoma furcatifolium]|nr:hypothetical protein H0H92_015058 [Tricholoma furcatifolium]